MECWGVPSGLDPSEYEASSTWDNNRWRWEFIRRRSDYRQTFDFLAPLSHAAWLERAKLFEKEGTAAFDGFPPGLRAWHLPPPPIDSPEFCAWPVWREEALFDYSGLPNPRFSNVPAHLIVPLHTSSDIYQRTIDHEDLGLVSHSGLNPYSVLPAGHVAIRFSLVGPISQQLEGLREYLESEAERLGYRTQTRAHSDKRLMYLRALDARCNGASWAEIADTLPASFGRRTPQTARDVYQQAIRMQAGLWVRP